MPMEPKKRETPSPTTPDDQTTDPLDREVDDPELLAWLTAREADLEEQAFALADQFDEEWRP
jgi:hypothetical protein